MAHRRSPRLEREALLAVVEEAALVAAADVVGEWLMTLGGADVCFLIAGLRRPSADPARTTLEARRPRALKSGKSAERARLGRDALSPRARDRFSDAWSRRHAYRSTVWVGWPCGQ
jgi:hypothetical protein